MKHQEEFNSQIKSIFKGGKIRSINWGERWDEKPIQDQLSYAMELASAMNQAADIMQIERNDLVKQMKVVNGMLESAQQALGQQQQTLQKVITDSNARQESDSQIIQGLQAQVRDRDLQLEKFNGSQH